MYIATEQGQTIPRGQNFDVNRKALSLYPFVANFKEIFLKSDFIHVRGLLKNNVDFFSQMLPSTHIA